MDLQRLQCGRWGVGKICLHISSAHNPVQSEKIHSYSYAYMHVLVFTCTVNILLSTSRHARSAQTLRCARPLDCLSDASPLGFTR